MSPSDSPSLPEYAGLLGSIKDLIRQSQFRAVRAVNAELIRLYWEVGSVLSRKQKLKGYGAAILPQLARDLRDELPDIKGFSERNLDRMVAFARAYPHPEQISPQAVAKSPGAVGSNEPATAGNPSQSLLWLIPWGHHSVLLERVKDFDARLWYMEQVHEQGWSRTTLTAMIRGEAHARRGRAITNFRDQLPGPQSDLATEALKDPYVFDFLTLAEPFHERELETELVRHLERFLIELGRGFAFVGRQYHLGIGGEDFYLDLLFYHLKLRCFVVIDLKRGAFRAEHAGKMNFYLNVVDDLLRHESDAPSIGLILCQDRNRVVAEYALRGMSTPIGVSEYELTRALPTELRSSLPTIEAIEAELERPDERDAV